MTLSKLSKSIGANPNEIKGFARRLGISIEHYEFNEDEIVRICMAFMRKKLNACREIQEARVRRFEHRMQVRAGR